jgi:hypothetical protein
MGCGMSDCFIVVVVVVGKVKKQATIRKGWMAEQGTVVG